ncbi:MAG: hypothetical protein HY858_03870 [Candidatus Solibacter usitatus]|nr:hypothetical protein [Candidatus Solibacter usitatus]
MRKPKREIKHTVKASIQILSLTKAGSSIELEVFGEEKKKIATVIIGRGSLEWVPSRKHKAVSGIRRSWTSLAEWFEKRPETLG